MNLTLIVRKEHAELAADALGFDGVDDADNFEEREHLAFVERHGYSSTLDVCETLQSYSKPVPFCLIAEPDEVEWGAFEADAWSGLGDTVAALVVNDAGLPRPLIRYSLEMEPDEMALHDARAFIAALAPLRNP